MILTVRLIVKPKSMYLILNLTVNVKCGFAWIA